MTLDEFKIYADWGARGLQAVATVGVFLYTRYIARNRQVDRKFDELGKQVRDEIKTDVGGLRTQLERHEEKEEAELALIDRRLDKLEVAGARTPTMKDLAAIHEKINVTNAQVAAMSGQLKGIDDTLRLILNRMTAGKGSVG